MAVVRIRGGLYKSFRQVLGWCNDVAALLNAAVTNVLMDGVLQIGTLAISAVPEKFKTTTVLIFREDGIQRTLAATDNLVFASAYTINTAAAAGFFWGAFLVEATGVDTPVVTAKAAAADQAYATEAEAIAALPAATAGSVAIGYITVKTKENVDWVAQTDDLTDASDCTSADFYDADVLDFTETADIDTFADARGAP